MNIAFFTNNFRPFVGGVPIAVEGLARRLRQRGHRVLVFAPEYEQPVEDEPDVYRIWSIKNFNDSRFPLPIPLSLEPYALLSETKIDIVHVHHPFLLGQTGLHLARSHDLPVVFTYHTQYEKYAHYMPFNQAMVTSVAAKIGARFANCCDAVIAPSSDMEQMLRERGVTTPIRVIPTGVDLQAFKDGNRKWLRSRFGIGPDEKILLFVSRLAKEKNVEFLLRVFARALGRNARLRLVLVGSGDEEACLQAQASELGIGSQVVFAGTLRGTDLVSAYKGSDLFVFASVTETQGMVVLEAMAAGMPVVAVSGPGVRDIVTHGRTGLLLTEGDEEGFAAAVLRLVQDDELRARLGQQAHSRARQLSLAATTRKVESLYEAVKCSAHLRPTERFMVLREFLRYQFDRFTDELNHLLP